MTSRMDRSIILLRCYKLLCETTFWMCESWWLTQRDDQTVKSFDRWWTNNDRERKRWKHHCEVKKIESKQRRFLGGKVLRGRVEVFRGDNWRRLAISDRSRTVMAQQCQISSPDQQSPSISTYVDGRHRHSPKLQYSFSLQSKLIAQDRPTVLPSEKKVIKSQQSSF